MSIIGKLKDQPQTESYLVWGVNGSGRTTAALGRVSHLDKVLYVGFSGNGFQQFADDAPDGWDSVLITDWAAFEQVIILARKGELDYDAVVLDDYSVGLEYINSTFDKPHQNNWAVIANKLSEGVSAMLSMLNPRNGVLVATLLVVDKEKIDNSNPHKPAMKSERQIDLNQASRNRLTSKFSNRWYTYAVPKDGAVVYGVQQNSLLASKFSAKG